MGDVVTLPRARRQGPSRTSRLGNPNANLSGPLRPLAACCATCAIFDEHGPVARHDLDLLTQRVAHIELAHCNIGYDGQWIAEHQPQRPEQHTDSNDRE